MDLGTGLDVNDGGTPVDLSPGTQVDGPSPAPSASAGPANPDNGPSFGSAIKGMFGQPNYRTPDPQTSALDQSADLLDQRVKRANEIATNPFAQFFAPEQVQAARDFVPKAAEELQKIKTQKAAITSGRQQAEILGIAPGEVADEATAADRMTFAVGKALKGDMRAFSGIQAVSPETAAAIAPQVHEVVAGHLDKAQLGFDSLAGMQNQGQYNAKLQQLREDGTLKDLEALGMKVPPTYDAFNATKGIEGKALREARIGIENVRKNLEERNTYAPMDKKEQDSHKGLQKTVYGDEVNGVWARNGASGTRAQVLSGLSTVDKLGKGGSIASPEQRKELGEDMARLVPKEELEKQRNFSRTYKLATTDGSGKEIPINGITDAKGRTKYINDNPNVQQGIAEGLASMLRGGSGGATAGLLNIETGKRGFVQAVIDKVITNVGGGVSTLKGEQVMPYLSQLTQQQQREVLDGLKSYSAKSLDDRALQTARRAGALGLDASALGLGKNETNGAIDDAIEEGRKAQIERMRPNFQAIGGGDGVLQMGAQRPGAGAVAIPPGTAPTNQLPGAQPVQTPVQAAQNPPQPGAPAPQQPVSPPSSGAQPAPPVQPNAPGGAGPSPAVPKPVSVAGQDVAVALPQGATDTYVKSLQRIESGNEKDPWKAGAKGSSASGAFQFIDSTWKANKPEGAPNRAADATPEQQTEALSNLTNKNAAALSKAGVEVNDTNLYIAHNLGEGAGPALLKAPLTADARSIVGEAAARNNPLFFKGRPTVATVLGRYQAEMAQDQDNDMTKPRDGGGRSLLTAAARGAISGVPGGALAVAAWDMLTPAQKAKVKETATDELPAIGGVVGSVAGGMAGNVPGGIAGGAAGSAAGQSLKDYLKGNDQNPKEILKQGALGGVLGVASEARPVLAAAGRMAGVGAIDAGAEAANGGDTEDVLAAGGKGAAAAAGGELFGRALGMVGHKVYSMFAPEAQKSVQTAAKTYAEAKEVLNTEAPKLPGVGGAASGANPKYEAAEAAKQKAETTLKDAGLNPEEAAYAHKVSTEGVPQQEARVAKPGAMEQQNIGQGYQQLASEVGDKGVGTVKATPKLPDGPMAIAATAKMSPDMQRAAERTEMTITAPAANWQDKWTQLQNARSALLTLERDAQSSTTAGRTQIAEDYRTLADTVRTQQAKAAEYVFGKAEGQKVMDRLKVLDVRYRNLMEATNGGDLRAAAALKDEAGRDADRKFRAFAQNDPAALAAWSAMRQTKGDVEKDVKNLVAFERIPVIGKVYSAIKLMGSLNEWTAMRAAGSKVTFAEMLRQGDNGARATRDAVSNVTTRAAVQ